jgi:hypothetical protein
MNNLREVRIFVNYNNSLRKVCKILFSKTDASLYLIPYAKQGKFYYGKKGFKEKQISLSFDFTKDFDSEAVPKLSIHEKGQVHIKAEADIAGPLFIPPLDKLSGQHVATICPDDFESLPYFKDTPISSGTELDRIITVKGGIKSGKFLVYINGYEPEFPVEYQMRFDLRRSTIPRPLYVCILGEAQEPLGFGIKPKGVTILAGWNPDIVDDSEKDFLYIRGI